MKRWNEKEHYKKYPWKLIIKRIKLRCNNPNSDSYKYYGERGIECRITVEELKFLWFRDKAYNMKKPSIDRKENNDHYQLDNCRFIELSDNIAEKNRRNLSKSVLQYDLQGNFIKEWNSTREIERELGINHAGIVLCIQDKLKTSGGYKWRYKK